MAGKTLIGTKETYLARPSIPAAKKVDHIEFNRLVSIVDANYLRLILKFDTDDIGDDQTLEVGQYVDQGNILYRVTILHSVGTPKAFTLANYQKVGESVGHSSESSAALTKTLGVDNRTYTFKGTADAVWTAPAVSGNAGMKIWVKHRGDAGIKLTVQKTGSDRLFTLEPVESIDLYRGESCCLDWDDAYVNVL